ncbi:LysR family transcriptional regulator, partial [Pseudomonas sp. HMWF031]
LEGKRIETLTVTDKVTPMSVGLAWHREREFSPAMQAFRNYFHDTFLTSQQMSARR